MSEIMKKDNEPLGNQEWLGGNSGDEGAPEQISDVETVKEQIEECIQRELVYAEDYYKSPDDRSKYEQTLRELANSSPNDSIWTEKNKAFHREIFELVQQLEWLGGNSGDEGAPEQISDVETVKEQIEECIQRELVYAEDYYKSPDDRSKYEQTLRELANSSPNDSIWTEKNKAFHREIFELVQQLEWLK